MPHLKLFTAKYAAKENIKKCYLRKPSFPDLLHGWVQLGGFLCKHEYILMCYYSQASSWTK